MSDAGDGPPLEMARSGQITPCLEEVKPESKSQRRHQMELFSPELCLNSTPRISLLMAFEGRVYGELKIRRGEHPKPAGKCSRAS